MAMERSSHRDCRNYAPVDAAKGVCHRTKDRLNADGERCPAFEAMAKCGLCTHYTVEKGAQGLGLCRMSPMQFLAYADMAAATCGHYSAA